MADARAQALLDEATASFQRAETGFDAAEDAQDFATVTAAIGRGINSRQSARALTAPLRPNRGSRASSIPRRPAERLIAWTHPDRDPRTAPVCEADAELVETDEQPTPRNVVVGDDVIPYRDAPGYFVSWFSGYFGASTAAHRRISWTVFRSVLRSRTTHDPR